MASHDLDNRRPVRNRFVGGRQAERTSRCRHLTEEPLDTGGTEEKQHPRLVGVDVERVADALRRVQEGAWYAFDDLVAMLEPDLAREHKEEFVLVLMGVKRRRESPARPRSEERRVGKEWRVRWVKEDVKEKS